MDKAISPSTLCFYLKYATGFATFYIFPYWASSFTYVAFRDICLLNHYLFSGIALILLGIIFLHDRKPLLVQAFDWVNAAMMIATAIAFGLWAYGYVDATTLIPAVVLTGCSQAWLIIRWSAHYGNMETKKVLGVLLTGIIIVSASKILLERIPSTFAVGLFILLSLTCPLLLHTLEAKPRVPHPAAAEMSFKGLTLYWRTAVAVLIFFAIWSSLNIFLNTRIGHLIIGATSSTALTLLSQISVIVLALIIFWWVFIKHRRISWIFCWQLTFSFLALALLIMQVWGITQTVQVFISIAVALALVFVGLVLSHIAYHSAYRAPVLFAFGYAAIFLTIWATRGFGLLSKSSYVNDSFVVVLLFIIVIVFAFCLPSRSLDLQYLSDDINNAYSRSTDQNLFDNRIKKLATHYGLSKREQEILEHLSKGRSKPYIAETLYISESTVKTYTSRIYQKLEIHNRQKLIDLLYEEDQ